MASNSSRFEASGHRSPLGTLMRDVGVVIRARGAGTAHMCWRSETGWVGPSWEWIAAQS
jgi:hypothetical protein